MEHGNGWFITSGWKDKGKKRHTSPKKQYNNQSVSGARYAGSRRIKYANNNQPMWMDQEMMGWKQAQNHGTMTWTRRFDPHNIVDSPHMTTGASSAIHQYHLDECQMRRFALGGRSRPLHPSSPQIPFIFAVFRGI